MLNISDNNYVFSDAFYLKNCEDWEPLDFFPTVIGGVPNSEFFGETNFLEGVNPNLRVASFNNNIDFQPGTSLSIDDTWSKEGTHYIGVFACDLIGNQFNCPNDPGNPGGPNEFMVAQFRVDETCSDAVQNQDETDIDCGGVCGPTCLEGDLCNIGADCVSGICGEDSCAFLPAVLGPAAQEAVAYVGGNDGLILRFDGEQWQQMNPENPRTRDIWGTGVNDVYFVGGQGGILHYNGNLWDSTDIDDRGYVQRVWGTASDNVYVTTGNSGKIVHYDGADWQLERTGQRFVKGIWGSGANDIYISGDRGTILHFDGEAWSQLPSGVPKSMSDMWGTAPDNIYAVGEHGTISHFDGNAWASMDSGVVLAGNGYLQGIDGTGPQDIYAVGDVGTIIHYDGVDDNDDGSLWDPMVSGTASSLNGVWIRGVNDIFAVGNSGTLIHYDGQSWESVDIGTDRHLYSIWGPRLEAFEAPEGLAPLELCGLGGFEVCEYSEYTCEDSGCCEFSTVNQWGEPEVLEEGCEGDVYFNVSSTEQCGDVRLEYDCSLPAAPNEDPNARRGEGFTCVEGFQGCSPTPE
ncbi:MAG TPA: hypothetical protein DHN29_19830 [Cytophagales bacterium]|nr:hypothetical protein [Cytophagales bacterium]